MSRGEFFFPASLLHSLFSSSCFHFLSPTFPPPQNNNNRDIKTHLDRVVDRLGKVVPEPRDGAREVERRRRRVDGGADCADGRERVVCRVLQSRGGNVAVHEGVGRRVQQRLALLRHRVLLGGEVVPGRDGEGRRVDGRVDGGEVFDGRRDHDFPSGGGDLEGGGGDDLFLCCFRVICWCVRVGVREEQRAGKGGGEVGGGGAAEEGKTG